MTAPRQPRERGCFHTAPCSCPNRYLTPAGPLWPLGWAVPDHVEVGAFGENEVQLRCKVSDHEVHERTVLKTFETDNRIGYFLKEHAHGATVEPLEGVLPETPEQPREERPTATPRVLLGWTVPSHIEAEIYQGRFWGLCLRCDGERKVTLDYEAEAVAFLKDHSHGQPVEYRPMPGCCGGCDGTGAVPDPDTNGKCADCFGTGHMHTGSCDPVPAPQSSPVPLLPLSASVETVGGEGDGTEALSVHWYPVVDDTIGGWAISNVDLPVSQIDTRGRKHFTVGNFLTEEIARHLCELHNSTLSSPLPADEVERPRRCPALVPEGNVVTEGRQCQQYEGHAHRHTWYGDNGSAYSAWEMTS